MNICYQEETFTLRKETYLGKTINRLRLITKMSWIAPWPHIKLETPHLYEIKHLTQKLFKFYSLVYKKSKLTITYKLFVYKVILKHSCDLTKYNYGLSQAYLTQTSFNDFTLELYKSLLIFSDL